jgi:hypothetical protein
MRANSNLIVEGEKGIGRSEKPIGQDDLEMDAVPGRLALGTRGQCTCTSITI